MGLAETTEEASKRRHHTPKLCLLAGPQPYTAAGAKVVDADDIDVIARIMSMGRMHHAITGMQLLTEWSKYH